MHLPRTFAAASIAAVTAVGLLGCTTGPTDTDEPTSITIAVQDFHFQPSWGSAHASLWYMPQSAVYEPVIIWDDEANKFAPWLAERFEISEDGLSMSLDLHQDVLFSDGTPLDAEGVAKVLNAAWSEGGVFQYLASMEPHVTATGEYSLELTTGKPLYLGSELLTQLSKIPIISPAAIDDPSLVATEPIGTGPYLLDDLSPEVSATFVRNPDYWNSDAPGNFDEVTIVAMSDKVAALNALKSGQIDAAEIDSSLAAEAEASGLTINTGSSTFTGLFIVDRQGANNPPLGDVRVRQALSYAIDRAAIVEEIERGYGDSSSQPFDPTSNEFVEGADSRYAYDPDKARELLAEAGYPDGFTIKLPAQELTPTAYAPIVEQYFAEIGVTIEWVDTVEATVLASKLEVDGMLFPLLYSYTIGAFANLNQWWTTQPVEDPEFLEMMELYNGSPEEHEGVLEEATEYVLEQAWYIVISKPETIWASSPEFDVSVAGGLPGTFVARLSWFSLAE